MRQDPAERPYFASKLLIIVAPIGVFCINFATFMIIGADRYAENSVDKIRHIMGGASITITFAGILWYLVCCQVLNLADINIFRLVVCGLLSTAIILWEVLEHVLMILNVLPDWLDRNTYADTITDMIFGFIGGVPLIFNFKSHYIRRIRRNL